MPRYRSVLHSRGAPWPAEPRLPLDHKLLLPCDEALPARPDYFWTGSLLLFPELDAQVSRLVARYDAINQTRTLRALEAMSQ